MFVLGAVVRRSAAAVRPHLPFLCTPFPHSDRTAAAAAAAVSFFFLKIRLPDII